MIARTYNDTAIGVALNANIDRTPLDDAEEDDLALGPAEGEDNGGGGDEHDGGDGHQGGNKRDGGDGRDGSDAHDGDVQDGPTAGAASSVSGSSARGVPMAIATSMTSPIVQAILPQARVDSPYLAALARYHVTKIAAAVVHSITTAATDAGASSRFSKLVGEAANAFSAPNTRQVQRCCTMPSQRLRRGTHIRIQFDVCAYRRSRRRRGTVFFQTLSTSWHCRCHDQNF